MRLVAALIIGKIVHALGSVVGKASNLPGAIALKICPDMLGRIKFKGKIIAVTGSNGKTSSANMVAHVLKQCGYSVTNNAKGSNLLGGVATTLLSSADLKGNVSEDFVVLEVDERFSRLIFKHFSPDYMLVTNLFRDQLTRNGNVDVIIEKLTEAIKPRTKLILNADDPISSILAENNDRVYYGLDRTDLSTDECLSLTHDAKVCPKCFGRMKYSFFHYNHIGSYECSACGYKNAYAKYRAENINVGSGDFSIGGIDVHTEYKSVFNVMNMTGVFATCCEVGVSPEKCADALSRFVISNERFDEFEVDGRKGVMILSKNQNPVSFDQSISYVLNQEGEKTVIVYVNNINHTNNLDTTWLYDVSFNRLKNKVNSVVCTGPRAYDLAVRLELDGFDKERILVSTSLSDVAKEVRKTSGTLYIMTELYDAKSIVSAIKKS